jgi:hypothetical protein
MSFIGTEFQEVPHFCPDISPLFPVTHPKPAANPLVNLRDRFVVLCNSKVVYPSSEILSKFHHPVIHGYSPAATGELTDTSLKLLKRLVGPTYFTPLEGKAKK